MAVTGLTGGSGRTAERKLETRRESGEPRLDRISRRQLKRRVGGEAPRVCLGAGNGLVPSLAAWGWKEDLREVPIVFT